MIAGGQDATDVEHPISLSDVWTSDDLGTSWHRSSDIPFSPSEFYTTVTDETAITLVSQINRLNNPPIPHTVWQTNDAGRSWFKTCENKPAGTPSNSHGLHLSIPQLSLIVGGAVVVAVAVVLLIQARLRRKRRHTTADISLLQSSEC